MNELPEIAEFLIDLNELPESAELLIDGHHGVYIPKLFADTFPEHLLSKEREVLKSEPDDEEYWQIWEDVLDREFVHPILGKGYLYQDSDLWLIPNENV